jgi:type I restriction enzyme S subunit
MSTATLDTTTVRRWKRYPQYRPSGADWLPQVPGHWNAKRLKYLAAPSRRRLFEKPDDTMYIGLEQIESKTGKLLLDNPVETVESNMGVFDRGDVLFGKLRPYLAKVASPSFAGVCTTEVTVYRPRLEVLGDYLKYQLLSAEFIDFINTMAYGTKMPRVSEEQMGEARLAVPPLAEQRAIAAFLDRETARIDALIGHKERLIALLEEKRQAVISHAVTRGLDPSVPLKDSGIAWLGPVPEHWRMMRLKYVASKIGSGKTPRGGGEVYSSSGVLFLRSQNVHFDGIRLNDVVYISKEIDREMSTTRVLPNDVLLNITGASLGRCCLVPETTPAANVNQHVCIIRPVRSRIEPAFLNVLMASRCVQDQIFSTEDGVSREGLNFAQIAELVLCIPPTLEEQRRIVNNIHRESALVTNLIARIGDGIARLQEYRTALISAAVTGQIDVRGEVGEPAT